MQDLCPNGVKMVKLGDVANISRGVRVVKKDLAPMGSIPVYQNSMQPLGYYDKTNTPAYTAFVISAGAAGDVGFSDIDFWAADDCLRIQGKESLNNKYAYYWLLKNQRYIYSQVRKASIPRLSKDIILSLQIPLPPLAVQSEIVRVLDKFTLYKSELAAELAARLQQYEYYRDKLLTFDDSVKRVKLGEVFELRNGYTPSRNNHAFWDGGTIPWYRMEDIRKNGRILSDSIQHITPAAIKGKGLFKKDSFILATTATIGEHALLIADSLANQQFTNLQIRKSLKDSLLTKFVFYYMYVVDEFCKNHTNKSGFDSVDMKALVNMPFPLPPLSEQERIVSILDRFDKLCHDIREGLPAEIDLRQKQYEHYRDRLLTFRQLGDEAKG